VHSETRVAVKVLAYSERDAQATDAVASEVEMMYASRAHENIAGFLGAYRRVAPSGSMQFALVVTELCARGSLGQVSMRLAAAAARTGGNMLAPVAHPIPEPVAAYIARSLLRGLAHLHALGIAHRDVKGDNVLITVDGRICLADLGAAAILHSGRLHYGATGTPQWMAPDMCACNLPAVRAPPTPLQPTLHLSPLR
jgi:serine/threonine protein kinase